MKKFPVKNHHVKRFSAPAAAAKEKTSGPRRIVLFNKPFDVLPQFTDEAGRATLKDFIPLSGVYAARSRQRRADGADQ